MSKVTTDEGIDGIRNSYRDKVWVIEIKVAHEGENTEQKVEEAFRQIIEKNYATPYSNAVCLGLGIDDTLRQISASRVDSRKLTSN